MIRKSGHRFSEKIMRKQIARWSTPFDDPIALPRGRALRSLRDAARYIQKLPKAEQGKRHWQLAVEILINAAEGRDFLMHARIAVLKAMHHGEPPPAALPRRKAAKAFKIVPAKPAGRQ